MSVHLAHIKFYRPRQSAPAPDFYKIEELFLGKTLPTPALEESETVPPHISISQVADVVSHRRRQGRHSPHSYIDRLRLKGVAEAPLECQAKDANLGQLGPNEKWPLTDALQEEYITAGLFPSDPRRIPACIGS